MQNQQISSDLIRGHIDTIILHTLLDGDKFAEQISDTIEKKSESAYKINQATLYSALKRLESSKYVSSYQKDAVNGRRKFFTLTESGKEFADSNLSSWSFSREIIDKLIDCAPQPIIKTEYVEKIVQVPVERTVIKEVDVAKDNKEALDVQATDAKNSDNNNLSVVSSAVATSESSNEPVKDVQEVNFRNVLNELIQSTNINKDNKKQEVVELSPIVKEDLINNDIKDFNQTITEKSNNSTKIDLTDIDFSDLVAKSKAEGFKISISSKNVTKPIVGQLLKNKLNLIVSLVMFLILSTELLVFTLVYKNLLSPSAELILGLVGVFAIWPIICFIMYKKSPIGVSLKDIYPDSILTSVIIVFNLLLMNFAGVMLFDLDFSIKKDVVLYLILPAIIYFNIIIYSVIRFYISKSKLCKVLAKN